MESELTLYEQIGGEKVWRELVERFYFHMDSNPEMKQIRSMHGEDLSNARERLFAFLSGWSGGPQLFMEKYGHPRLRMRHLRFPIGKLERDQWLQCMLFALDDLEMNEIGNGEIGLSSELKFFLMDSFYKVADHMRNREEPEPEPVPVPEPKPEPESNE